MTQGTKGKISRKGVVQANLWKAEYSEVLGVKLIDLQELIQEDGAGGGADQSKAEFAQMLDRVKEFQLLQKHVAGLRRSQNPTLQEAAEGLEEELQAYLLDETANADEKQEQLKNLRSQFTDLQNTAAHLARRKEFFKGDDRGAEAEVSEKDLGDMLSRAALSRSLQDQVAKLRRSQNPNVMEAVAKIEAGLNSYLFEQNSSDAQKKQLDELGRQVDDLRSQTLYPARRKAVAERLDTAGKDTVVGQSVKSRLLIVDGFATGENHGKALEELNKVVQTVASRRDSIRREFEEQYARVDPLDVRIYLAEAPTKVRAEVVKDLDAWNFAAATAKIEKFKTDIDRAVRRKPGDLGKSELQEVYQKHAQAGQQNARYVRNVEQARSAALRVVDPYGRLDPNSRPFAEFPFVNNSDDLRTLQAEIAASGAGDIPQSTHALKMLKKLNDQEGLRNIVHSIAVPKPPEDAAFQKSPACGMIRSVLGLPADFPVGDAEARRAAVASLLTKLRQHDVGSCFATSIALQTQAKNPEVFLKDVKSLIETGTVVRSRTEPTKAVTFRRGAGEKPHETPAPEGAEGPGRPKGAAGGGDQRRAGRPACETRRPVSDRGPVHPGGGARRGSEGPRTRRAERRGAAAGARSRGGGLPRGRQGGHPAEPRRQPRGPGPEGDHPARGRQVRRETRRHRRAGRAGRTRVGNEADGR
jgi:hypothetical protein